MGNTIDEVALKSLHTLADENENAKYIEHDLIAFPHTYSDARDIEISALVTSCFAFGGKAEAKEILNTIHKNMNNAGGPYQWVRTFAWTSIPYVNDVLYYNIKNKDLYNLADRLHTLSIKAENDERYSGEIMNIVMMGLEPVEALKKIFALYPPSFLVNEGKDNNNFRFHLLLRWMCRKNSDIDFGIWDFISSEELKTPVSHKIQRALINLGLITADDSIERIYDVFNVAFPCDPARGSYIINSEDYE